MTRKYKSAIASILGVSLLFTGCSNTKDDTKRADAKEKARWKALKEAEKILFEDAVIAPLYQNGSSYLERSYVKGIVEVDFAGPLNFKWAKIEK